MLYKEIGKYSTVKLLKNKPITGYWNLPTKKHVSTTGWC